MFKESKKSYDNMQYKKKRMDDTYTEKNYTNKWKRKGNDYTTKYNVKMTNNMEMKVINVKGKEKIAYNTKGSNT